VNAAGLPPWTIAAPVFGAAVLAGTMFGLGSAYLALVALALAASVFASVHHAETIAHKVGEPFGTLVLALSVTLIEVALIVALSLSAGHDTATLARDTVYAAVMIILNGIIGLSLLLGGLKHSEQQFRLDGVSASLAALAAIAVLTLVYPNYTVAAPGPYYSPSQLGFIALVSVAVYGGFVFTQTFGNRQLFLDVEQRANPAGTVAGASTGTSTRTMAGADAAALDPSRVTTPPSNGVATASAVLLLACLSAVVLLAKKLAPSLEVAVERLGAPRAVVGVIIAAIVLLPEGLSALRAARDNRLQTSLNLALGSALASIGLTIPAVGALSIYSGAKLALGIDTRSTVLLMLSLFVTAVALRTGRTILLHGIVLLVIFAVYLFMTVVP
jgi:Ca2+:H+ antiporter